MPDVSCGGRMAAVLDHFRAKGTIGTFYSVPRSCITWKPLGEYLDTPVLNKSRAPTSIETDDKLQPDVDMDETQRQAAMTEADLDDRIFFTLVDVHPRHRKGIECRSFRWPFAQVSPSCSKYSQFSTPW